MIIIKYQLKKYLGKYLSDQWNFYEFNYRGVRTALLEFDSIDLGGK